MSTWTFWRVPTGPPPPYFVVFVWLNLNQSKNTQRKPTRSGGLHFFAGAFWLCRLPFFHFNGSSINRRIHEPQSAHPNKVTFQKLSNPFAKLDANDQLYILYVQIYKHKDVVSLRVSSSPRISAKILHQRLLPFVAAISSVFTRPFRLPVANHQRRWKAPRSWGQTASQMNQR